MAHLLWLSPLLEVGLGRRVGPGRETVPQVVPVGKNHPITVVYSYIYRPHVIVGQTLAPPPHRTETSGTVTLGKELVVDP